jgi:hypothetical protein
VCTISERLSMGREGFARVSVRGRILSPKPAAKTIAFMMLIHHKSAWRHRPKSASDICCTGIGHGKFH